MRSELCTGYSCSNAMTLANHVLEELGKCTGSLSYWNKSGIGPLVSMKGNLPSTSYEDILENGVLPTSTYDYDGEVSTYIWPYCEFDV